jgi:hypothetical protein
MLFVPLIQSQNRLLYPEDGGRGSSKTTVPFYQTTMCHILEDSNLHIDYHESPESHLIVLIWAREEGHRNMESHM